TVTTCGFLSCGNLGMRSQPSINQLGQGRLTDRYRYKIIRPFFVILFIINRQNTAHIIGTTRHFDIVIQRVKEAKQEKKNSHNTYNPPLKTLQKMTDFAECLLKAIV